MSHLSGIYYISFPVGYDINISFPGNRVNPQQKIIEKPNTKVKSEGFKVNASSPGWSPIFWIEPASPMESLGDVTGTYAY